MMQNKLLKELINGSSNKNFFLNIFIFFLFLLIIFNAFLANSYLKGECPEWDCYHYLVFSQQIKDSGGIPEWNNFEFYPNGRPFLYPPLLPGTIAFLSQMTSIDEYSLLYVASLSVLFFFMLIVFLVLRKHFSKEEVFLTLMILFFFSALDIKNSVQFISQFFEILLIIISAHFISKNKYLLGGIFLGLSFFVHAHTPFLPLLGLFLLFLISKNKKLLVTWFSALVVGLFWIIRFILYSEYVGIGNKYLFWLKSAEDWFGLLLVYGSTTILIFSIMLIEWKFFLKQIKENEFYKHIFFMFAPFVLTFYYVDRVFIYLAPLIAISFSIFIFRKKNLSSIVFASFFLFVISEVIYLFFWLDNNLIGHILYSMIFIVLIIIILFFKSVSKFSLKVIILNKSRNIKNVFLNEKNTKRLFDLLVIVLLFALIAPISTNYSNFKTISNLDHFFGHEKLFYSGGQIFNVCNFVKENRPNAIIAQPANQQYLEQVMFYCNYVGIKSKTGPVVEFTKDGYMTGLKGATLLVDGEYNSTYPKNFIYQKENYVLYDLKNLDYYPIQVRNDSNTKKTISINFMHKTSFLELDKNEFLEFRIDFDNIWVIKDNEEVVRYNYHPNNFYFEEKFSIRVNDLNNSYLKRILIKGGEDGRLFYPLSNINPIKDNNTFEFFSIPDLNELIVVTKKQ